MSRRAAHALLPALLALGVAACLPSGAARPTETPYVFHSPTPEPTASWHKLQEAYVVAADRASRGYTQLFAYQRGYPDTKTGQHRFCEGFLAVDEQFLDDMETIPWTPDYQAAADEVIAKTKDVIKVIKSCIRADKLKDIHNAEKKMDLAYSKRARAVDEIRKQLHLPIKPLR